MMITLYVPRGKKNVGAWLDDEISQARNIKSKSVRESVLKGLLKIKDCFSDGVAFFWTGEELFVVTYPGTASVYRCDKKLFLDPLQEVCKGKTSFFLVVLDANEATIGLLSGKGIKTLWHKESFVPRKHDAGGQSQRRFEENRSLALKAWLKEVGFKLQELYMEYEKK